MAYYDALISAWNGATQPPSGATGTAITAGMTTAQKLAAVNGWTVAQAATFATCAAYLVLNAIQQADLAALTTDQKQQLTIVLGPGLVDPTPGKTAASILANIFSGKTTTLAALTALQNSLKTIPVIPWWQSAGYPRAFDLGDVAAAGVI